MDDKVRKQVIERKNAAYIQVRKVCDKMLSKKKQLENLSQTVEQLSEQVQRLTKIRNQIAGDIAFYESLLKTKSNEDDEWDIWNSQQQYTFTQQGISEWRRTHSAETDCLCVECEREELKAKWENHRETEKTNGVNVRLSTSIRQRQRRVC